MAVHDMVDGGARQLPDTHGKNLFIPPALRRPTAQREVGESCRGGGVSDNFGAAGPQACRGRDAAGPQGGGRAGTQGEGQGRGRAGAAAHIGATVSTVYNMALMDACIDGAGPVV